MQTTRTATGYQLDGIEVDAKPYSGLPPQQARTLLFVARGLSQKEIAREMGVQPRTIQKACYTLSYRFGTQSMRATVHAAIRQGVLRYSLVLLLCVLTATNSHSERTFRTARCCRTVRSVRTRRLNDLQNDLLSA